MFKKLALFTSLVLCYHAANAGGVSLGATRLVFPTDKNQVTIKLYNSDADSNYLVQSWITDSDNKKVSDFIITPPLFVIHANSDSLLNVVFVGDKNRPRKDQEQLYYLNTKVIPSLTEAQKKIDNALLISTTTKIKLFFRPSDLRDDSFSSYKKLICSYDEGKLKIENPTPFFMNLSALKVNGKEISPAATIEPKSSYLVSINERNRKLSFNFINDYGVQTKDISCNFK